MRSFRRRTRKTSRNTTWYRHDESTLTTTGATFSQPRNWQSSCSKSTTSTTSELQETKAYSPASIGKAYLRSDGNQADSGASARISPKAILGYAQSAFFGGRTSAHIRKVPVPVVYTDFLSMYPTVNSLMDLWRFVTARKITVVEHCQGEIQLFLHRLSVTSGRSIRRETWKNLTAFVRVIPDGDILPSRGRYSLEQRLAGSRKPPLCR